MSAKNNIKKQVEELKQAADKEVQIDQKLDELIALLNTSDINSATARQLLERVNKALDDKATDEEAIKAFTKIDDDDSSSREELLEEFTLLLSANQVDSNISKKYLRTERLSRLVLTVIGLVLVTLGMAMIIMPAPQSFEMFTIYYFTQDDGVTLMDIISLLIVLSGIYLIIKAQLKLVERSKKA